ncbi:unnamed protein product [Urochloa humidicola]
MASVVVSASTGVMNSLLSKLSMLLSDQYKQLKGVRKDIEFLSRELIDMNAALEKLADMEKLDGQTKVWRNKVREMAYDIEDCIDIFMHHHGEGDEKDGLFHKTARKIRKLRVRYQISGMIQDLKARVEEHSQSQDRYKIDESISKDTVVEVDPRLPALFEDAKRLVGIDGPREEITKWLMEGSDTDSGQLVKVVSIVGFGGLGKTTLSNQVYRKIKDKFECNAFVSVSRSPDMPTILKDILSGVGYNMQMVNDVHKLILTLRGKLANKRYLIVIDDLWSIKAWDTIKCAFVQNNEGSRVITTTRIQGIATACCFPCQDNVYLIQPLNELHSRSLFFKRIFGTEDGCPHQFKEISEVILKKCKGVPLAITSIASLLANKSMDVETWEKIHNSLGSELDTNPTLEWMRHVLRLSYNDLSHELKTCFLYLGVYPEDRLIHKYDLVHIWIAEGFISEKRGLDLEDVAENYFNELINRSMVLPSFNKSGVARSFRVHDLMLDLIVSKCSEENFITINDGKYNINGACQVRRISHQFNTRDMALPVKNMESSHIRSYNSFLASACVTPLSKFQLLRVLNVDHISSATPESSCLSLSAINHLFLLKYVKIRGFCLELPKKFGKLKHLMTIDIAGAEFYNGNQSSDFTSLTSLRNLNLAGSIVLRNGLSHLCNLRAMFHFDIWTNSVECIRDLGELTNLRELGVVYADIPADKEEILAASLVKLVSSNLRKLHCVHKRRRIASPTPFWNNCFMRPRHLQFLFLERLPTVPKWMAHANKLAHVDCLQVEDLRDHDIQVLGQLPCLVYLRLIAMTTPERNIIINPNTFPSLKYFNFSSELFCLTFEPAAMPRLQSMWIRFYSYGRSALQLEEGSPVAGIEHLASLEEIIMHISAKCCSEMESATREAIHRHPKSHTMQINVSVVEVD